jgi:hypothetical protein
MTDLSNVSGRYSDFALATSGQSACFEQWANEVAGDHDMLAWIAELPEEKQQPNLVFAAARWHGVSAPGPYSALPDAVISDHGAIRETIMSRSTQTNEVGRLATLLPAFANLGTGSHSPSSRSGQAPACASIPTGATTTGRLSVA